MTFITLFQWGSDLWEIIGLSLEVSLSALLIAMLLGLPLSAVLAMTRFRGQEFVNVLTNTLMSLPPVVIGLLVYMLLARSGPLGVFGLLYTPTAMVIAQVILITPIIVALGRQHLEQEWQRVGLQLKSLGVDNRGAVRTLFWECRLPLVTVILAAFGRAIAEIGAVMIVGGNIDHLTRVMTTAIALETSKGNLELALALGAVLLIISLAVNFAVHLLGRWTEVSPQ